jgi:hypothetical protein
MIMIMKLKNKSKFYPAFVVILFSDFPVRSLIKLNATVTSQLPAGTATMSVS